MKLHFLGANRQVTGSRYALTVAGREILIDCGLFQERKYLSRNWESCPRSASHLAALLLTHAHLDHCGLIPRLVQEGFRGPIYATEPTAALLPIMLFDSADIQVEDLQYKRKRHQREGRVGPWPYEPLYTRADVERVLPLVRPCRYLEPIAVVPGVTARFWDAGHILGSAMIELEVSEGGGTRRVVFSGDIGQTDKPIVHDPSLLAKADYVVMESTYGDRTHARPADTETQLAEVIGATAARGGNVIIPTFAVERAQELLYHLGRLLRAGRIPQLPVFLDSPMAVDVTAIYRQFESWCDAELLEMVRNHQPPFRFPTLTMVRTAEESKRINHVPPPVIIMASSGMCNAGRIKHHLKQNIERPQSTILFVGHQGEGTLGRQIVDGERQVRIHGQTFQVRAQIAQIYGFSGHADHDGLVRWIRHFQPAPRTVFLTHGEEPVALGLARELTQNLGLTVQVPHYCEVADLP